MFLLSVLMSFGMVGMMAPKASSSRATKSQAAAAKAKAKAKAKALANETSEKKRKQSNMVGQLKNASLKLQKVKQGDVKVSESEMEELEAKQKFWVEYCGLSHFDDKKNEMLEAFSFDKTCTKWATRTKEISQETYQNASGSDGYLSSSLVCIHFLKFFFPTGVGITLKNSTPTKDSKWLSRRISQSTLCWKNTTQLLVCDGHVEIRVLLKFST